MEYLHFVAETKYRMIHLQFQISPPHYTAAMLIVSPWFGNIWENGHAIWFIWFMSLQLLSIELEEPWCYIHQQYYLCLKCWYMYSAWTSVRVVEFNYIYFVLSVIWRKATKDGINSFQNQVYIFAKMTKGVNFPRILLLLSVAPSKAYPPRWESLCWMWWEWATPRFKEMISV